MNFLSKFIFRLFRRDGENRHLSSSITENMKKFLIVGLGNIGPEYEGTRHNAGFMVVDSLAEKGGVEFSSCRYGDMARLRVKNCELLLLKPSTFMNLSGVAVRFWMNKENLPLTNLLVVVDDIALPFGAIRLRGSGSEAGHNGLKNITQQLGNNNYARLRFGVGNDFPRGGQVDYVLGKFPEEEREKLPERLEVAGEAVKAFCLSGLSFAMTNYNNK
ncbi:MAG: aminoacyl-tRNA hydrolase [Muribaculaceae bacterium]|nr:aminoacyl-tRNA hydrolase [Muribaculaceae bacterium]